MRTSHYVSVKGLRSRRRAWSLALALGLAHAAVPGGALAFPLGDQVYELPAQRGPRLPAAADLDRDGLLDLVVTNVFSSSITILWNEGGGAFQPTHLAVGRGPRHVLAEDLDADGDLDLAVTDIDSRNVAVLLNNGNGS